MSYSGKFVLRVGPHLHKILKQKSYEWGISLNEICRKLIANSLGTLELDQNQLKRLIKLLDQNYSFQNPNLVEDYLFRAEKRLSALAILHHEKSYADVVREAGKIIELSLKALLRFSKIDPPRIHDVSQVLLEQKDMLPKSVKSHVARLAKISKSFRRDRELAFYGSEDLTPSEFYSKDDGDEALESARYVVKLCRAAVS